MVSMPTQPLRVSGNRSKAMRFISAGSQTRRQQAMNN